MRICISVQTGSTAPGFTVLTQGDNLGPGSNGGNYFFCTAVKPHESIRQITHNEVTAWFLGDPITAGRSEEELKPLVGGRRTSELIKSIGGHFRLVMLDRKTGEMEISGSLFGILPFYYHHENGRLLVSDDLSWLSNEVPERRINKRFIVENLLFYYPLFNETIYDNIRLLPAHSSLVADANGNVHLYKHTNIADWFSGKAIHWKKDADELSDIFINRVQYYLPDERYAHALTGGFDSRTLVACALHHRKDFYAYGFGNTGSEDTQIAARLAKQAGLSFRHIDLDDEYVQKHSLKNGLDFIRHANGCAGFARAHYLYASRMMAKDTRVMVTGNFGSEIFRAAHNAGAVISPNLYRLFRASSHDEAIRNIEQSAEFRLLSSDQVRNEWKLVAEQLKTIKDFSVPQAGHELNRSFYQFVFEEVFRKYFGPEMVNQYRYMNNRTPFLDTIFLQRLLQSGMAGVYSDFFENNPAKRFKGQVLYAHILKKTYLPFFSMETGKGYRPEDLLSLAGKLRITAGFLRKKLFRRDGHTDPNSVSAAFNHNLPYFRTIPIHDDIFNADGFHQHLADGYDGHEFLVALGQAWYVNQVKTAIRESHSLKTNRSTAGGTAPI